MLNKTVYIIVFGLFLLSLSTSSLIARGNAYYLVSTIDQAKGKVDKRGTSFRGEIVFRVVPARKGQLTMFLHRLNLVSAGVGTARGKSGVIGLNLAKSGSKMSYDPRTGKVTAKFQSTLHYELIDKKKGYRRVQGKHESDIFPSYTEVMVGNLVGKLPEQMRAAKKGQASFNGELKLEISKKVLGAIRSISLIDFRVRLEWVFPTEPAEILKVQPVFIGSGSRDPNVTGEAFETLIRRASEIWNRCGTVRCLRLLANPPRYVNNDAYRVIDNSDEAADLRAEVDVADAVEVFVVERLDLALALRWGGGATWGSGTASTKIVTCDQQLDVPCPAPCTNGACRRAGATPDCGAVNYYHLAHELGHALNLDHPTGEYGLAPSTVNSNMEPSGFCCDNPNIQSARNCRNASNPLLYWGRSACTGSPDIID